MPVKRVVARSIKKARAIRYYGTDKPLPRVRTNKPLPRDRTRPGEVQLSEQAVFKRLRFVGERTDTQREPRTQTSIMSPKWPKFDGSQVVQPKSPCDNAQLTCDDRNDQHFFGEGEVVLERHKRQPDTTYPLPHERSHLRSRINLPAGSKLAQRFPQHVRSDGAVGISSVQISYARKIEHTGTAQAESNKRRRRLPFKMRGSTSGQCTEVGPS